MFVHLLLGFTFSPGNDCTQDVSTFCFNGATCTDFVTCECDDNHFGQNCRYSMLNTR